MSRRVGPRHELPHDVGEPGLAPPRLTTLAPALEPDAALRAQERDTGVTVHVDSKDGHERMKPCDHKETTEPPDGLNAGCDASMPVSTTATGTEPPE